MRLPQDFIKWENSELLRCGGRAFLLDYSQARAAACPACWAASETGMYQGSVCMCRPVTGRSCGAPVCTMSSISSTPCTRVRCCLQSFV